MWWVIRCINPQMIYAWLRKNKKHLELPEHKHIHSNRDTDINSSYRRRHSTTYKADIMSMGIIWCGLLQPWPRSQNPRGLRAIMSHLSEVKAPSTLTCSNAQIMTHVKSRNYELGISFASFFAFLVCPWQAWEVRFRLIKEMKHREKLC